MCGEAMEVPLRLAVGDVGGDADALDVDAGGKDVDEGAKVAERGLAVVARVDGADGDGVGRRRRRAVGRVLVLVAGGDDGDDAGVVERLDGVVDGRARASRRATCS